MTRLFATVTGQDDNIGDSALRRGLLDAVRPAGVLELYVGQASADYLTGLGLSPHDVIHRSRAQWRGAMARASLGRNAAYIFNAGEITPGARSSVGRISAAVDTAVVSISGGGVVQTGAGLRRKPGAWKVAFLPTLALSNVVTWRDAVTAAQMGRGTVEPDWAFVEGSDTSDWAESRPLLAISMRGDRPAPSGDWIAAVRHLALERQLEPVVVVQVKRDNQRASDLARSLSANLVSFDDRSHKYQESTVRSIYSKSSAVVSDRLHALIFGATEGAQPIGYTMGATEKLERTLHTVGLGHRVIPGTLASGAAADRMVEHISETGLNVSVDGARVRLTQLAELALTKLVR